LVLVLALFLGSLLTSLPFSGVTLRVCNTQIYLTGVTVQAISHAVLVYSSIIKSNQIKFIR